MIELNNTSIEETRIEIRKANVLIEKIASGRVDNLEQDVQDATDALAQAVTAWGTVLGAVEPEEPVGP